MNSQQSTVMSNDLQSTQSDHRDGQISQIPGLSMNIISSPVERAQGRRAAVSESDSDYVKLAKQGGHKGLLWHVDTVQSKPVSYKPPGWLTGSAVISEPSLINSAEKKNPRALGPREPPFGTDNMSAWERDDNSSNGTEKNNNVLHSQMEKLQVSNQYHETSKFKKIAFDKRPASVNMSKLLSFGYVEDHEVEPAKKHLPY